MRIVTAIRTARDFLRYHNDEPAGRGFTRFMVAHSDPYHLCTEFDEDGSPTPKGLADAERFIASAKNWTEARWWLYETWERWSAAMQAAWCEIAGHDFVSEDWGGPDSGGMGARCKRCGWSWSHTLY